MDLGSCPSEVVERAVQSRELKRSIGRLNAKDLVLKVAGKEEYMLEEKSISSYQVSESGLTQGGGSKGSCRVRG